MGKRKPNGHYYGKLFKDGKWRKRGSGGNQYLYGYEPPHFPVPALRTETGFKMYYGKDQKPERLVLGTWLIDRLNLRYLLYVFKWRVMI